MVEHKFEDAVEVKVYRQQQTTTTTIVNATPIRRMRRFREVSQKDLL